MNTILARVVSWFKPLPSDIVLQIDRSPLNTSGRHIPCDRHMEQLIRREQDRRYAERVAKNLEDIESNAWGGHEW